MHEATGTLVLMGSGEFTSTMVEVHKDLLRRLGGTPRAVYLDTPAGFELNCDHISARAVDYFRQRVGHRLQVVSLKSAQLDDLALQLAYRELRAADYALVGPGSPTYAVRQWQQTAVPEILTRQVLGGGCLVAASAAALTMGCRTQPVYEIYKVGAELHWAPGVDLLGRLGLSLVVIPHWNNAEGGTHDTRFCYMGEIRHRALVALLPPGTGVLGIDEHTACIIDWWRQQVSVRGIGDVTVRYGDEQTILEKGALYPLAVLRGEGRDGAVATAPVATASPAAAPVVEDSLWQQLHRWNEQFYTALAEHRPERATQALLEVDRAIWAAHEELENPETISQGRELLREMLVALGSHLGSLPRSAAACLAPLVAALVRYRGSLRDDGRYREADGIRDCLLDAGVTLEDTPEGPRWRLGDA